MSYQVRFVILVDRPELRGPTFPQVAAGTRIPTSWEYSTQTEAVRVFQSILDGQWDYGSEFICKVEVVQIRTNRSPRSVRRPVVRSRS